MTSAPGELLRLCERALRGTPPGEEVELYVRRTHEVHLSVHEGAAQRVVAAQAEGVGVRVIRDGRTGFAYAGSLVPEAVDEVVRHARDNCRFGQPDQWAGLPQPDDTTSAARRQPERRPEPEPDPPDVPTATGLAQEAERVVGATRPAARCDTAEVQAVHGETAVVSTAGVRTCARDVTWALTVVALVDDGAETRSGFGATTGRSPDELRPASAAEDAVGRALVRVGAVPLATQRLHVVLSGLVVANILDRIAVTLHGEAVASGRSLFAGRLGDQVASPLVTLVDDPTDRASYACTPIDGEGLATRRNVLIDDGVLVGLAHSSYSARRAETRSTANAVRPSFRATPSSSCHAVRLSGSPLTEDTIAERVGTGLHVDEVTGIRSGIDPVSGALSLGAAGRMIRGGELAEPVRGFALAGDVLSVLQGVSAVGGPPARSTTRSIGIPLAVGELAVVGT